MEIALKEAEKAFAIGEIPVGSVIVSSDGSILSKSHNLTETNSNPLCHAEILAINLAVEAFGNKYLNDCTMYVTLEPCAMCAQAISYARIKRLYFGAEDIKFGAIDNGCKLFSSNKNLFKPEIYGGLQSNLASGLLKDFFYNIRAVK